MRLLHKRLFSRQTHCYYLSCHSYSLVTHSLVLTRMALRWTDSKKHSAQWHFGLWQPFFDEFLTKSNFKCERKMPAMYSENHNSIGVAIIHICANRIIQCWQSVSIWCNKIFFGAPQPFVPIRGSWCRIHSFPFTWFYLHFSARKTTMRN